MTAEDTRSERARLVGFAVRWLPFGGGSAEEIFVEFGLTQPAYLERLAQALQAGDVPVSEATRAGLEQMCARRSAV